MSAFISIMDLKTDKNSCGKHQEHRSQGPTAVQQARRWLHVLWLFTYSDLKTIVFPSTFFALFNAAALKVDEAIGIDLDTSIWNMAHRLPLVIFWTWINVLAFNIGNQRQPDAVQEDKLNKPWRPIPAGLITIGQARVLGILAYPAAFLASLACGGLAQSVSLFVLGFVHNELGCGNNNFITRNLLNAGGFTSFISGALDVALKSPVSLQMMPWFLLIAAVVLTTIHSQDMYDQEGDTIAGRKTIPLIFGDRMARWSIAVAVFTWSWLSPMFWTGGWVKYAIVVALGSWVCRRTLWLTTVRDDRTTFIIYNCWLVSIYALPVICYSTRLRL